MCVCAFFMHEKRLLYSTNYWAEVPDVMCCLGRGGEKAFYARKKVIIFH